MTAAPSLKPPPPEAAPTPNAPADHAVAADDLREIVEAYHAVTERLQHSHETLQSEVLRLREELASADAQLQRSKRLAALGQMAAGIAHEVRNPLAAIGLYAEMIEQDAKPLPDAQALGVTATKITDAVRGLSGIVNDVLNFARPLEPRPRTVALRDLLARVVEAHQPVAEQQGVDLALGFVQPADVLLDIDLMHQALLNLVRNAVDAFQDFQAEHGKRVRLSASLDPGDAGLTVRAADTGPGIDDDTIDRIFNPFFTTRHTGTGLGRDLHQSKTKRKNSNPQSNGVLVQWRSQSHVAVRGCPGR
ncbi:MAG: ATP-binding protein, partial [Planctomycetota bacterium]